MHLALLQEYKTYKENFLKRFQLTKLPPYLVFCIKRFTKNNFFVEKNPTIVNFPITYVLFTNLKNKYWWNMGAFEGDVIGICLFR